MPKNIIFKTTKKAEEEDRIILYDTSAAGNIDICSGHRLMTYINVIRQMQVFRVNWKPALHEILYINDSMVSTL